MEHKPRFHLGGVVVVSALTTAGILFFGAGSSTHPPTPPAAVASPPSPAGRSVTVHVAGEVERPGLYAVADGARIADAVAAAGGITRYADLESINLAAGVSDGDQIVVPAAGAVIPNGSGGPDRDGTVHLNTADAEALQHLPGVGPVLAGRIVEYRDMHGPFSEIEDLLGVPGIGEAKLATLRDSVAVP